jgi:DNA-binding PadR family transcriptional regulator
MTAGSPGQPVRPAVFHILVALAREDLHGLGIAQAVEKATKGDVRLGPGTLYRSLKEMAVDRLIEEVVGPPGESDPRRRFYAITSRGREVAQDEASRLARLVELARANDVLPQIP